MSKTITQGVAAEILGVTVRRMRQIIAAGDGPPVADGGAVLVVEFGKWLRNHHAQEFGVAEDGEAYDLNAERARLAKHQADKTELEVAELHGELVRTQEVTDAWAQHIAAARAKLLALPSKIAPRVAPPESVAETQELLRGIVDEVLNELAGDGLPERARARVTRAKGVAGPAKADGKRVGRHKPDAESGKQRRARKVDDRKG